MPMYPEGDMHSPQPTFTVRAMPNNLTDIISFIDYQERRLKDLSENYEKQKKAIQNQIAESKRQKENIVLGNDLEILKKAETYIEIGMKESLRGDDLETIEDVIKELIQNDGKMLKTHYIGTKNYDRWSHQGISWTQYGYGPTHGSVVFAIKGTTLTKMEGINKDNIEACLYLLEKLKLGHYQPKGRLL